MTYSNEKDTRQNIIDQRLKQAGWNVSDRSQVIEEFEVEIDKSPGLFKAKSSNQFSDYVLLGRDGKPLAVIEAKKSSLDASVGREQAKQYCYHIKSQSGGELPFCFYTNGHDIFFWDLDNYPPKKVYGFPTRDDLERLLYIRRNRKPLAEELINTKIAGRDYQLHAIRSVMESIEKRKRKFLLVMATGTGKTRTCIALVDSLMKAGWVERVLFLVDRIALRNQALDAFKENIPNEPRWPKENEEEITKDRRIYVSTYPTMLNIIRDDANPLSPHFFDLVIVDESHRSIYNTYQEILNYFHSITLGLTATPTDVIDHNTFKLFDTEDGVPTFAYSYEEAINHIPPYLSDFQVMKIRTKFQEQGINKRTITLEDQRKLMLEGKNIDEINYEGSDLEKKVINSGTNSLIVREFMEESIKDQNGVLPGKTIFFCISKKHARRVEEIFDSLYPEYKGELAKVMVSEDPRVHGKGGLLDQFTNQDMPRIAISVDMLDTGIDIREIVNLVFAKPVFSYTKFWQMIGRGTRLLEKEKLKHWCTTKDKFLILDCWDNFDYFKVNPKGKTPSPLIPLPIILFGLRLDKIEKAIQKNLTSVITNEINKARKQISELPRNSVVVLDAKTDLVKVLEDSFWEKIDPDKLQFLHSKIKPLFRTISNVDFKAMRFEKDILEFSIANLMEEKEIKKILLDAILEKIAELPLTVNIVAKEKELIQISQTNEYWENISEEKMNHLVERLSPLMKFRETLSPDSSPEKFNLEDLVEIKQIVEFGPEHSAVSIAKYRELVEEKIQELIAINPILKKIKSGQSITEIETEELAEQLYQEHPNITIDLLRRVYNNRKAELIQFLKHILGIEKLITFSEEVSNSFDSFIKEHSYLSSRQMQFLDLLRNFILERGELEKKDLIQSPFTLIHPDGIRGVFKPNEIDEIIDLAKKLVA